MPTIATVPILGEANIPKGATLTVIGVLVMVQLIVDGNVDVIVVLVDIAGALITNIDDVDG
jgi:hypothetical protein